ncbi:Isochorismatase-like protein [Lineolata rhizophorae]|uniref:Isochorismatase-like protein n=1 Tax=Lineolata rhizophorae TaxID=578093 RepID=A0A6A6NT81_9PEZI|nr:Isochorismatase-like protein [Lineolata rhizophorae]
MTAALLIVDMQMFFAEMGAPVVPAIEQLTSAFAARSLPVILTQHGHPPSDLTTPSPNMLVRKWGIDGSIHHGSEDWELMPEISSLRSSGGGNWPIVQKNTYDAFIGTELEELLRKEGVERVIVCGVMTDCCCDTTARAAFNRGFDTWLVRDACASANERQHHAGLSGFEFAFGEVPTTKEAIRRLDA